MTKALVNSTYELTIIILSKILLGEPITFGDMIMCEISQEQNISTPLIDFIAGMDLYEQEACINEIKRQLKNNFEFFVFMDVTK